MTDEHIEHMTQRFLRWRLPDTFNPDNGISFKAPEEERFRLAHWPIGTNLFDYNQAKAMVQHMIEGSPLDTSLIVSNSTLSVLQPHDYYLSHPAPEAASRIAELEAKLATAVGALKPFGRIADWYDGMLAPDDRVVLSFLGEKPFALTVGHCRQAQTFLASIQERT